jgi:hypothetical protein
MHEVLAYVVNLWDIAESRAWETEVIPKNYISDPLVLTDVSRQWSQFITWSSQLWSYLLIDTDDEDALEYLQLFLKLSRNRQLFIALHGSAAVCDAIVTGSSASVCGLRTGRTPALPRVGASLPS